MAAASESEAEEDVFLGFDEEERETVAAWRQQRFEARNQSDLESDISVSSVSTEDLSDFEEEEDEEETWNENPNPVEVSPFTEATGPTSGVAEDGTAIDFFYLMFPEELIEQIVAETNRYARECIATKPDREWYDTTLDEMKAFIGLHVLFGIKRLPANRLNWSEDPLIGIPFVQKVTSRNRFDKLSTYFHLNDNANQVPREDPGHDKLFKCRPVLDRVVQCCKMELRPQKDLSVDEAMVKFKGRLGLKQYMPMKPVKRGIKVWVCAEASSGFVCDFQVYTGKRQDGAPEQNLGYRVVHDLTRSFTGKNHHVFYDNFFSTVKLAEDLLEDQIYSCATARANRKDFPKDLAANNPRVKRLKQGEALFRQKNNVVATTWKDKKVVHFISTESNPVGNETVNRKQRDGTVVQVPTVPVVKSYNKSMGGVDLHDQLRGYYAIGTKSRRWWRYLFWFCVDLSIVNASILEKKAVNHRSRTQLAFRVELAKDLIGDFTSRGRTASSGQTEAGHWPIAFDKGRCKRCLKRKRTTFCRMGCQRCNKRVCLECFPNHIGDLS